MEIKMIKTYDNGLPVLKEGKSYVVVNSFGNKLIEEGYAQTTTGILVNEAKLVAEHLKKEDQSIHIHFDSKGEEEE